MVNVLIAALDPLHRVRSKSDDHPMVSGWQPGVVDLKQAAVRPISVPVRASAAIAAGRGTGQRNRPAILRAGDRRPESPADTAGEGAVAGAKTSTTSASMNAPPIVRATEMR